MSIGGWGTRSAILYAHMQAVFIKYYKVIFVILVSTIAILSFYVGMLKGREYQSQGVVLACDDTILTPLKITSPTVSAQPTVSQDEEQEMFAGSKNGTKYYTPGCAGLERIKPENRVWFKTAEDAVLQGYTPANC